MSECQMCHGEDAKIKIYVVSPTVKTVQTVLEFCDDCYDEMKAESDAAGQDFNKYWEIDDDN